MISLNFALSRLRRKKLEEVIAYERIFLEYKYVKVKGTGIVLFAKNILQYIFKPEKLDFIAVASLLDMQLASGESINEKIDSMYANTIAKKYNLLKTTETNNSLRELLRKGGLKDSLYVEKYINLIYGYVKDKYTAQLLSIIEILDSAKNVIKFSTDRVDVIFKNAILRELALLRSPPNRTSLGLLRVVA